MYKKLTLAALVIVSSCQPIRGADSNIEDTIKTTIGIAAIAGATYLGSSCYAKCVYETAKLRFAPERYLLDHYSWAAHYQWDTNVLHALIRDIKTEIVRLHNMNRSRWDITVLYSLLNGQQAQTVARRFKCFPLLQHMDDLNWYIWHLKCISILHLHSDRQGVSSLIEQLAYVRNLLRMDHDFNEEEQRYAQHQLQKEIYLETTQPQTI